MGPRGARVPPVKRRRGGWLRRIVVGLAASLVVLLLVVLGRAVGSQDRPSAAGAALSLSIDRTRASETLAEYVRFDSSSPPGIGRDPRPPHLDMFIERYAEPLGLEHRVFEGRTLLLVWRAGEVQDHPLLMLTHSDVVPVPEDELEGWSHPPFSGVIDEGYVWGRGTIDNKGATVAQLEAIAALQAAGLRPRRDIFLLVSPDQEVGGERGARAVLSRHAEHLESPWAVLDEGTAVGTDYVPETTLVPIGVAEKRSVTVTLTVVGEAGHSSVPRRNAAPRVLSVALGRLAELEHPSRIPPATEEFLNRVADHAPLLTRIALKNRWLFDPMVRSVLEERPAGAAMIHDTMALTHLETGVSNDVVPARAVATLNLRLLPGSDLDTVLGRLRMAIDDPRVTLEVVHDAGLTDPSPVDGPEWSRLEGALAAAYPEERALITPTITPSTLDARHFAERGIPTFRFLPFVLDANERGRVHGVDERLSIENLEEAARVYAHLMRYW